MCGRFALVTDLSKIAERFNIQKRGGLDSLDREQGIISVKRPWVDRW